MRYFFVSAIIVVLILFSGFFLFSTDTIKAESSDISNKVSEEFTSLSNNAKRLIGLESNKVNSVGSSVIVTVTVTNIIEPTIPSEFSLSQNYPNPFNPTTQIQYILPSSSHVIVTVYYSLGQTVKVFNEGTKEAGNHNITFNGEGLSSGIYLYSVNSVSIDGKQNFTAAKKMLLLK